MSEWRFGPSSSGRLTRRVSGVVPSDAGFACQTVEAVGGLSTRRSPPRRPGRRYAAWGSGWTDDPLLYFAAVRPGNSGDVDLWYCL